MWPELFVRTFGVRTLQIGPELKPMVQHALHTLRVGGGLKTPWGGPPPPPPFLELLGLPMPPSRKTFALSCRVSASSWHISAPSNKNLSVGLSFLLDLIDHMVTPNPPKLSPGASKIGAGASKIEPRAFKNAIWKASCFSERSGGDHDKVSPSFWPNLAPTWRPKRLQNRGRNPEKSMLKNHLFSDSLLSWFRGGFGEVFGRFFGAEDGGESEKTKNRKTSRNTAWAHRISMSASKKTKENQAKINENLHVF